MNIQNFIQALFSVIKEYIRRRFLGFVFLLFIVLGSIAFSLREQMPSYLNWSLYLCITIAFLPFIKLVIDEFDEIVREVFKLFRSRWLVLGEFQLSIQQADNREVVRRKVSNYVNRHVAKEERAFQTWKSTLRVKQPKTQTRPIWIVLAAAISGLVLFAIFNNSTHSFVDWFKPGNPSFATLITLIVGLPVAYLIWLFRDQNNLWHIENSRKDVNLKDFQRLSELACGTHYPEFKEGDTGYDQRLIAAQSLQVGAIYQLKEFMEGAYGVQFMRPSFLLLVSVWTGLIENDYIEWASIFDDLPLENSENWNNLTYSNWRTRVMTRHVNNVKKLHYIALQEVLTGDSGFRLRLHKDDLNNRVFNLLFSTLESQDLKFSGVYITNLRAGGSNLTGGNFQSAKLLAPLFSGSNLTWANFEYADLRWAKFVGANLFDAHFECANLFAANFKASNLERAHFQGADLRCSNLIGTNLSSTNFRGADLRGSLIDDSVDLSGCVIDDETMFGELVEGVVDARAQDEDWIKKDEIRQDWIRRGATEAKNLSFYSC